MRCLLLVLALLVCAAVARADSLADLRTPFLTIPGCAHDWGAGSGRTFPRKRLVGQVLKANRAVTLLADVAL